MANVSSSNGLEKRPKLRFPGFDEPYKQCRIGDIYAERSQRGASDMELLSVTMNDGVKPRSEIEGKDNSSEDKSNYKIVRKGDMVYNSMRMWQGANGISPCDGIVSPAYTVLMPKQEINNGYFAALFKSANLINEFRKNSQGMTSDTWNLKYPQIETIKVQIPSVSEQDKVSEMFSVLDERIAAQSRLVESLKKYKRGLLSQLIAQKKAFDTSGEWKTVKLGHIFKERTERAKGNETLLAVTISNGVQRRDEIDLKDNSSDDKSNYKCVYIGDIAYNTMRMWQGASGVSPYNGIVSPAYTIVTPIRPDLHNMTFWAYYFKYSPLVQTFQKYSQGLTSDTWNLKFPQFSEIAVTMPPISEQDKIAECLSVFDEHCKCEDEKLQALLQVRTSLLQQLFI
ncbi:restriction endonuclease subunit S [Gemmiger qucibialis]|jgi:type I restriction enzyme S subunit|uniref:restriction endonuclease subunit S n=2 Tax=Bacillota TaxID=1239 RepID=UPI0022E8E335|nr:restriction endonuclease subunit S [Gemmiger qucibialis]